LKSVSPLKDSLMNRKFLLGVAIGAILAAVPILHFSRSTNAFEIDSDKSSVVSIPDAGKAGKAPLDDFFYKDDGAAQANAPAAEASVPDAGKAVQPLTEEYLYRADVGTPSVGGGVLQVAPALTEDRVRELIREEIKANPALVIDAVKSDAGGVLNALNAYLEGQRVEEEKNRDVKTLAAEPRLTKSEGYPYIGNPEGKVELFYYFDVNCHYCKQLEPELDRFVADNPDVKIIHREMPILADSSRYGAELSGLLFAKYPEKYAELHHQLMTLKPGMSPDDIDAALNNILGLEKAAPIIAAARDPKASAEAQAVAERVAESLAAASEAGVTGTPFVMVKDSGLVLRGAAADAYAQFQSMAAKARAKHAEKAAN
jgi:protein-disulfide isomerase